MKPGNGDQMPESARSRRWLFWLLGVLAVVLVVVSIGKPLIGSGSFTGADVTYSFSPWWETTEFPTEHTEWPIGDTIDAGIPRTDDWAEGVRDGEYRLTNPYPAGGGGLSSMAFAPSNALFVVFPTWFAPGLLKAVEMLGAIGFTFLFLRRVGVSRAPAVVGGVLFAFCGFQVAWTNWPHTHVAALIPALFWATERHLQQRRVRSALLLSLFVAWIILEGFPAVAAYGLTALALYVMVRVAWVSRHRLREALAPLVEIGVATGLGVMSIAFFVIPFGLRLTAQGLERSQVGKAGDPLALVTGVVPNAFGLPNPYFGPTSNWIEMASWFGAAAFILVGLALLRRAPEGVKGDVRWFVLAGAAVCILLIFFSSPVLDLVQKLPLFSSNPMGRLRSVMGFFLAASAAIGLDTVLRGARRRPGWGKIAIACAGWAALTAVAVLGFRAALNFMTDAGERAFFVEQVRAPLVVAAVVVAAVVVARFVPVTRVAATAVIAIAIGVEAFLFVSSYWPTTELERFYAETPAHEFLTENLGAERVATDGLTMYPGTNVYYDLRFVAGHEFHASTWQDLLRQLDPGAMRTNTFSHTILGYDDLTGSVLDRMSARYVVFPEGRLFGEDLPATATSDGTVVLEGGESVEAEIEPSALRGLRFELVSISTADPLSSLRLEILGADGEVLAEGSTRLINGMEPGPQGVAVLGEDLDEASGPLTVRLTFVSSDGSIALAGDPEGTPALTPVVVPDDGDGLQLVSVDGATIYERLDALPRIRWASEVVVEEDAAARPMLIASGLPADTVVLSEPGPEPDGAAASIEVAEDGFDEVAVSVDAEGAGYVVFADAKQEEWYATVDGEPAELVAADHAMVAVFVEEGTHEIVLSYRPRAWTESIALSLMAILAVSLLLFATTKRGRNLLARVSPKLASWKALGPADSREDSAGGVPLDVG